MLSFSSRSSQDSRLYVVKDDVRTENLIPQISLFDQLNLFDNSASNPNRFVNISPNFNRTENNVFFHFRKQMILVE